MKKWIWFVIGGLVFLGAAIGVIYGVVAHKEPGFMEVCWVNSQAIYSGDCTPKVELKWQKANMPLPVFLELDAHAEKTYRKSIVAGFEMWNKEIGPVFRFVDKKDDARVFVTWGAKQAGSDSGGDTRHEGVGKPERAYAQISEPSDIHAVMRYSAHEAGHVLGLAHDEAPRSIMYPKQPETTADLTFVLPSDADKALLRATYIN